MYLDYFGLKERPFSIAPDPRYLYMSERHREALAHLLFGVSGQGGFVLLTGEVGTGKTTICRCFLDQVPENTDVAFVVNPKLSARELMASICDELDIDYPDSASIKKLNDLINEYLLSAHAVCRHTVLIIDEAQNLSVDVLEQLRLLTNLETSEKKLLQIVLLGQPELRDILSKTELRQLSQRITARYHLSELSREETHAYVKARLHIAGCKGVLFSKAALNKLHRVSGGVPRLINLVSDRALLGAYATQSEVVEVEHIKQACKEVMGEKIARLPKFEALRFARFASFVIFLVVLVFGLGYLKQNYSDELAGVSLAFKNAISIDEVSEEKLAHLSDGESLEGDASKSEAIALHEIDDGTEHQINTEENVQASSLKSIAMEEGGQQETNLAPSSVDDPFIVTIAPFKEAKETPMGRYWAFNAVFKRWSKDYPQEPFALACGFAALNGLECLHKQGNWRSLLKINRPSVLELVNDAGENFYVALLGIDNDVAHISYLNELMTVSFNELDNYWLGQYSVVWKVPPYMSNLITPGERQTEAQWLRQTLSKLNLNEGQEVEIIEPLNEQLKRFQRSSGLEADGIAGSMTLISLNSKLDPNVPKLKPAYFSAASLIK